MYTSLPRTFSVDHDVDLAVCEALDGDLAERHADEAGDVARELLVGVTAEDLEPVDLGHLDHGRRARQRILFQERRTVAQVAEREAATEAA